MEGNWLQITCHRSLVTFNMTMTKNQLGETMLGEATRMHAHIYRANVNIIILFLFLFLVQLL